MSTAIEDLWKVGLCNKPQTKCSECPNRAFLKLNAHAARAHLEGKVSVGTYAIREDDSCTFLAADFDKATWGEGVIAYKNAARELGIEVAVEGLTATPYRKDGHQPIIFMQCGPIRHEMRDAVGIRLDKRVIVRETSFSMPPEAGPQPLIHEVWAKMSSDPDRLDLIACDVKRILQDGRFPLILSERKKHLRLLAGSIREKIGVFPAREFFFAGEMGKRARKRALEEIQNVLRTNVRPYIMSTGSLIGEGFDLPELDTLVLGMPIAFKGRVVQYAGRLHRRTAGKADVLIFDYLDQASGLTISMFRKRIAAYKKMGYRIETKPEMETNQEKRQGELFRNEEK